MFPFVRLLHILGTGPLLIWVGLTKPEPAWVYKVLLVLGLLLIVGIGAKSFSKKNINVWYLIHAALFGSLLLYAGYFGFKGGHVVPAIAFSLMLAVGIAAFGYHLVRLLEFTFLPKVRLA